MKSLKSYGGESSSSLKSHYKIVKKMPHDPVEATQRQAKEEWIDCMGVDWEGLGKANGGGP